MLLSQDHHWNFQLQIFHKAIYSKRCRIDPCHRAKRSPQIFLLIRIQNDKESSINHPRPRIRWNSRSIKKKREGESSGRESGRIRGDSSHRPKWKLPIAIAERDDFQGNGVKLILRRWLPLPSPNRESLR